MDTGEIKYYDGKVIQGLLAGNEFTPKDIAEMLDLPTEYIETLDDADFRVRIGRPAGSMRPDWIQ